LWRGKGAKTWIKAVRSGGPKDLVFQSIRKGKPMNDQNIVRRHLRSAAEKPKMDPKRATWLARYARPGQRGCARQAGIDPKSIRRAMRHSQIPTTVDIYAQFMTELEKRASTRTMEMVNERIERARMTASVAVNTVHHGPIQMRSLRGASNINDAQAIAQDVYTSLGSGFSANVSPVTPRNSSPSPRI